MAMAEGSDPLYQQPPLWTPFLERVSEAALLPHVRINHALLLYLTLLMLPVVFGESWAIV
jgi:hypothetical protein